MYSTIRARGPAVIVASGHLPARLPGLAEFLLAATRPLTRRTKPVICGQAAEKKPPGHMASNLSPNGWRAKTLPGRQPFTGRGE
jgi:hypothetical protein